MIAPAAVVMAQAMAKPVFAQVEPLRDGGLEIRVYELPSQRVLTRKRLGNDGELPLAVSDDGQVAGSGYQFVYHWSRKTGWRKVNQFGLLKVEGGWTYGEESAQGSGAFSPDGKHFLFRIYGTEGAMDVGTSSLAIFRSSDLRRWVRPGAVDMGEWLSNQQVLVRDLRFELYVEDGVQKVDRHTMYARVTLPPPGPSWVTAPKEPESYRTP